MDILEAERVFDEAMMLLERAGPEIEAFSKTYKRLVAIIGDLQIAADAAAINGDAKLMVGLEAIVRIIPNLLQVAEAVREAMRRY